MFNESSFLEKTLESLKGQDLSPHFFQKTKRIFLVEKYHFTREKV